MTEKIDVRHITIGQRATYFDTGIWSMKDGEVISPQDLTIDQLKDFLRAGGGAVYLRQDGNFGWVPNLRNNVAELETALQEIKDSLGGPGYARHCWFIADKALVASGKSKYPAEFYEERKHAQRESQ